MFKYIYLVKEEGAMAYKREIWTQMAQAWLSSSALGLTASRGLLKEHLGIKSIRQINNTCFTDFGLEVLIGIGQVDLVPSGKLLFVDGKVDISDEAQLFVSEYFETSLTDGRLFPTLSKTYLQEGLKKEFCQRCTPILGRREPLLLRKCKKCSRFGKN